MQSWDFLLKGLGQKKVSGNIYNVNVQVLGNSMVGPYKETRKYLKANKVFKLPVEVHHIVGGEHLEGTSYAYDEAPCIVLEKTMHQQYHGRFSQTIGEYHARMQVGKISDSDKLALYHDMFVEQTGWLELWTISSRIITGSTKQPDLSKIILR